MYRPISQSAQAWISFTSNIQHACLSFVSVNQMAPTLTKVSDIQLQLTTHLSTRRDERLSWPGWLTYSGRFTHIKLSPVSYWWRAGQGKFAGQRPTFYHCATQLPIGLLVEAVSARCPVTSNLCVVLCAGVT